MKSTSHSWSLQPRCWQIYRFCINFHVYSNYKRPVCFMMNLLIAVKVSLIACLWVFGGLQAEAFGLDILTTANISLSQVGYHVMAVLFLYWYAEYGNQWHCCGLCMLHYMKWGNDRKQVSVLKFCIGVASPPTVILYNRMLFILQIQKGKSFSEFFCLNHLKRHFQSKLLPSLFETIYRCNILNLLISLPLIVLTS